MIGRIVYGRFGRFFGQVIVARNDFQERKGADVAKKQRTKKQQPAKPVLDADETRASVAVTVAWMVSLTMTLVSVICTLLASWYMAAYPDSKRMPLFKDIMLSGGALIGLISLGLLVTAYRMRRHPPPTGLTVFAACLAIAPVVTVVARFWR
ncbi:hypothetical protein [Adhaeretor mobilis]|uniref:Uncharacterized protein n=1 Tax=Adhaeretor mobilis TaxID=1930276 RepID=A0A517MSM1_9BACT|nr:hypothetical protein [Adhaeretor mobilis]QDS97878.1 hypothetical protein HG15A2_11460 [Adhaeretor mobilis]